MTTKRVFQGTAFLLLLGLIVSFWAGCEKEPSSEGLNSYFERNPFVSDPRVTPSSVSISPTEAQLSTEGQTINYSVAGGEAPYTWGVSKPSVGTIQALPDTSHAIYTATDVEDNNVIVADRNGQAAIGNINRPSSPAFQIIPSTLTITNQYVGQTFQFRAVGGVPPYGEWQTSNPLLGTIDQNGIYTVQSFGYEAYGNNIISLTDSHDTFVTATVNHQKDLP